VINRLRDQWEKDQKRILTDEKVLEDAKSASGEAVDENSRHKGGITVHGITDVSVRFSKCCSPIPGDEIVGYVTRGRGITIHRTDCVNIMNLPESERERLIDAEWAPDQDGTQSYTVELKVYATNRTGLLVDVSKIFTDRNIDLTGLNVRIGKNEVVTMELMFDVASRDQLMDLMRMVRQVPNVTEVMRSVG
jgi:guanosine-3',5'-bis(diphosphate) 3'-pyrophosphohydrolase